MIRGRGAKLFNNDRDGRQMYSLIKNGPFQVFNLSKECAGSPTTKVELMVR